ncbi:hypothetical protein F5141DRAFT_1068753 [Pisolithus sp. B1]|nr:hypothetical protein F5141DRAFT_1068753 [Pisolithus sp. B1]
MKCRRPLLSHPLIGACDHLDDIVHIVLCTSGSYNSESFGIRQFVPGCNNPCLTLVTGLGFLIASDPGPSHPVFHAFPRSLDLSHYGQELQFPAPLWFGWCAGFLSPYRNPGFYFVA